MRKSLIPLGAITASLLTLVAVGHGQSTPQSTFRAGIDLVRVDVTVLDRNRRPVRGLSAGDFTLTVDGKPQSIVTFAPIEVPDPVEPPARWMRDIAPDVVSNALDDRRLVLILMDDATSTRGAPSVINDGKRIARNAIDALAPTDLAAVAFTSYGRLQEFTNDRAKLYTAVDSFAPKFGRASGPGSVGRTGGAPLNCAEAGPRGGCAVNLLRHVADVLAVAPPGRKLVIYVGSLPFPEFELASLDTVGDALAPTLEMLRALQRANITVYTFDPEGLTTDRNPSHTLRALAEQTGGRAVVNTNAPWEQVTPVFQENSSYYLLGFNGEGASDGRFRKIQVRANVPGAEVRSRSGYFAASPPPKPGTKPPPAAIDRAIAQALPSGNLPMFAIAAPFATAAGAAEVAIVARIPETPDSGTGADQTGGLTRRVNVIATAIDGGRRSQGALKQTIDVTLQPGVRTTGEYEVISRLPLKPGRYQIRFAAENASRIGTVFLDVDVPDFAKAALSLSGLVLQKTPALHVAPAGALAALMPIVPTSIREFVRTDRALAFVRVHQGGSKPPMPVAVTTRIRNDRDVAVYDVATALDPASFGTRRAADHSIDIPLTRLAPGPYVLSVEASLAKATLRRDLRFTVR